MLKSKSLNEKVFKELKNHLIEEKSKYPRIKNEKELKNTFQKIEVEKRILSLNKEKKLKNKLTLDTINLTTTSKDKTSTTSYSPLSSTTKIINTLNNSISSNKIKIHNLKISNTINNPINNQLNNNIITPKKTKNFKALFLRNEIEKKKNSICNNNNNQNNKNKNVINLRKSFEKKSNKLKTPLKPRKFSDNSKLSLTSNGTNNIIDKYLEKSDVDIISSSNLLVNPQTSNFNIDSLNSNYSTLNCNNNLINNSLSERNKKGKSLSMTKTMKINHNFTISNIKKFAGLIPNKIKTMNFNLNLTLTTINEKNNIDNHHYEKNTVSTLNKKVQIKKIKTMNQNKNRNEENEEKGKTIIKYKRTTTAKNQNNTFSDKSFDSQNNLNNHLNNSTQLNNNINKLLNRKIENYILGKELGKGTYAIVRLGINKLTKKKYAIKIYTKLSLFDIQKKNTVKNEISILKNLDNENIMKMYEVIDTPKNLYLILEYINGISLLQYIKQKKEQKIDEKTCKIFFYQIVKGINYCQLKNICHRDIKLENILIIDNKKIKIIDFGFGIKTNNNTYHKFFCGTPSYMSPEIINKEKYIAQFSDIWSLGILLYTMLTGNFPFTANSQNELFNKINQGNYIIPNFISDKAQKLIKKILVFQPKNRPSTEEILLDEWFEDL